MGSITALERIYDFPSLRVWLLEDHLVTANFPEPELQIWNPTAAALWLLLADGSYSLDELVLRISDLFKICPPRIDLELNDCLNDWFHKQWIQVDEEGKYFISPKITRPAASICYTNAPRESGVVFEKTYCINGNPFRLSIRADEDSQNHPFLIRLTAITQGFLEYSFDPKFQLNILIDSECIYMSEDSQGYRKFLDLAEALNNCIQYFLKISAGESAHFSTFHAAALGLENNILFSGASGAGKSTLCALLAQKGWHYYGDDLVGLSVNAQAQGCLVPLPSGISIKANNWDLLSSYYPILKTLETITYGEKVARYLPLPHSNQQGHSAMSVKGIVFPRYLQNTKTIYRPITVINTLTELVKAGVSLHNQMSSDEVECFLQFLCNTPRYQLEYSEINEVNTWLSTLVAN